MDSVSPLPWDGGARVEIDEIDEVSESAPSVIRDSKPDAGVSDLFFLGNGGRTLPGSSVLSCLCNLAKSPYRLPT